jgi:hypothetical protein
MSFFVFLFDEEAFVDRRQLVVGRFVGEPDVGVEKTFVFVANVKIS